ncbi:MAG TPA: hypothetical protein VFU00_08095 [Gemmatimonadales bacterium]|nr:hypothetical protein [Gemmatimonadales bacterium]
MRARSLTALTVLGLMFGARPLMASGPVVFQRDGTYFHAIHAALQAYEAKGGAEAESDSTEAPKLMALFGGAGLGLAAYFVATSGGGNGGPDFPSAPVGIPGGILIPPPDQNQPAFPNQPYAPPGLPQGPTLSTPITVTPEPVSMTLLATGLAGLGGAHLRRKARRG